MKIAVRVLWIGLMLYLPGALVGAAPQPRAVLTPHEELIASQIGFEKDVLVTAREATQSQIHRLSGYDEDGYQIMVDGIVVTVPQQKTEDVLKGLRAKLKQKKCMAFVVEFNDSIKSDKIGVIRGADPYDILRVMHTNGEEEDISHEDIIEMLKGWETGASFEIIGAENYWVELEFKTLPRSLETFAEEVYDFCPNTVDEGAGTVSALIKELRDTKRLFLWWGD